MKTITTMNTYYTLLLFLLSTLSVFAQAPEKMSYQAVLRDADKALLTNQEVGMQIRILRIQGDVTTEVYKETHAKSTNENGLLSIVIGDGAVVSGALKNLDWSSGPYSIETATDPTGGSNYTITGTSELLSVPFALHATTATTAENAATAATATKLATSKEINGVAFDGSSDITITANASTLIGVVPIVKGGTSIAAYTEGDILYAGASNSLAKLAKGAAGQVLTMDAANLPAWQNPTPLAYAFLQGYYSHYNSGFLITYTLDSESLLFSAVEPTTSKIDLVPPVIDGADLITADINAINVNYNDNEVIIENAGRYEIDAVINFRNNGVTINNHGAKLMLNSAVIAADLLSLYPTSGTYSLSYRLRWSGALNANDVIDMRLFSQNSTSFELIGYTFNIKQIRL